MTGPSYAVNLLNISFNTHTYVYIYTQKKLTHFQKFKCSGLCPTAIPAIMLDVVSLTLMLSHSDDVDVDVDVVIGAQER